MHRLTFLLLAALLCACGPNRVILRPVPEKTAPLNERVRAFKDLAPESGVQTTFFRNGVQVGTLLNSVMLADGTRVEDPRDLLPAVDATSPTANYIRSFETKSTTASVAYTIAYVGFAAGLGVVLLPLLLPRTSFDSTPILIGFGVGAGIALLSMIPLIIGMFSAGRAHQDRLSAFQTYPRSLQRRLALEEDDEAPAKDKPTPTDVERRTDVPLRVSLF